MTPWGRTDKTPGAFNRPERLHASCLLQSPGGSGQGRQDKCLRAHIQTLWLEAALLKLKKKKKRPYLLTSMLLSTQICKHPQAWLANFWKGAHSKDFRLCRPHSFCCNYRICQRMEKRQLLLPLRVPSLGLDTAPGHCLRGPLRPGLTPPSSGPSPLHTTGLPVAFHRKVLEGRARSPTF